MKRQRTSQHSEKGWMNKDALGLTLQFLTPADIVRLSMVNVDIEHQIQHGIGRTRLLYVWLNGLAQSVQALTATKYVLPDGQVVYCTCVYPRQLERVRGRELDHVLQNPLAYLYNPLMYFQRQHHRHTVLRPWTWMQSGSPGSVFQCPAMDGMLQMVQQQQSPPSQPQRSTLGWKFMSDCLNKAYEQVAKLLCRRGLHPALLDLHPCVLERMWLSYGMQLEERGDWRVDCYTMKGFRAALTTWIPTLTTLDWDLTPIWMPDAPVCTNLSSVMLCRSLGQLTRVEEAKVYVNQLLSVELTSATTMAASDATDKKVRGLSWQFTATATGSCPRIDWVFFAMLSRLTRLTALTIANEVMPPHFWRTLLRLVCGGSEPPLSNLRRIECVAWMSTADEFDAYVDLWQRHPLVLFPGLLYLHIPAVEVYRFATILTVYRDQKKLFDWQSFHDDLRNANSDLIQTVDGKAMATLLDASVP
jgi:hypothetical protein